MALSTLTIQEWRERFRGVIRTLIPGASTVRGEDYEITSRMMAVLAHAGQGSALYAIRQMFATTADGEYVDRHAHERRMPRAPAAKASGFAYVEGNAGTSIPSGSPIVSANGTRYATTTGVVCALPGWSGKTVGAGSTRERIVVLPNATGISSDQGFTTTTGAGAEVRAIRDVVTSIGVIDLHEPLLEDPIPGNAITAIDGAMLSIEAVEAGAAGNREIGEVLTLSPPITNVDASARSVGITGGGDLETDAEFRVRIQDHDAGTPAAGNDEDWRDRARRTPGVRLADAIVFPGYRGLGTVDVLPIGVAGSRLIGEATRAKVQTWIDQYRPYCDDVAVVAPIPAPEVTLELRAHVHPDYRPDFGEGFSVATSASTPCTTSRIYLSVDPTSEDTKIEVHDRILIPVQVGARWRTEQRTVSAVASGASPYVDVSEPFSAAPNLSASVQPGGPASQAVLDSIYAVFDNLGPASYISIAATQYELHYARTPAPGVAFDGTVRASSFVAAVKGNPGVGECEILVFGADSSAPFADIYPNPQSIAYPGRVIVSWNTIGLAE